MSAKNNDEQKSDSLSVVCRHSFPIDFSETKTSEKTIESKQVYGRIFSVSFAVMQQNNRNLGKRDANATADERKSHSIVVNETKKKKRHTQSPNCVCNDATPILMKYLCADYITQFMLSYHVCSNDLIELCVFEKSSPLSTRCAFFEPLKRSSVHVSSFDFSIQSYWLRLFGNVDHHCFACVYS